MSGLHHPGRYAATALLVLWAVLLTGCSETPRPIRADSPASASASRQDAPSSKRPPEVRAAAILRDWDERRSQAWEDGDIQRLRALYVPDAPAAAHDVAKLRQWRGRGLRVISLTTQLLSVRVERWDSGTLRLRVRDRVTDGRVLGTGSGERLPADEVSEFVLELERHDGRWLMASVTGR